uniref:Uncharacterized protein n=1 Tax=Lepeophtheirus salmonis TaxID=72036 RepID=A0A0K2UYN8_LEPSM
MIYYPRASMVTVVPHCPHEEKLSTLLWIKFRM